MRRPIRYLAPIVAALLAGVGTVTHGQSPPKGGTLDTSFGTGGVALATTPSNSVHKIATQAVEVEPGVFEEMIIAGGMSPWTLARFRSNGTLDTSFGSAGVVTKTFRKGAATLNDIAVQPDDQKILVAGSVPLTIGRNTVITFAVGRYTADGRDDTTFNASGGTPGLVTVSLSSAASSRASDVVVQPDGKIVAVGQCATTVFESYVCAVRLLPDGRPDPDFGTNGLFTYLHRPGMNAVGWSVALQPGGTAGDRIVITAVAREQNTPYFAAGLLIRLNESGDIDTTFGDAGIKRIVVPGANETDFLDVGIDTSNRIVAAGVAYDTYSYSNNLLIARFLEDGTLDGGFGNGGMWTERWQGVDSRIHSIALQPDGSILAAGGEPGGGGVWRFLSSGFPDYAGFGSGGWVTSSPTASFDAITLVQTSHDTSKFVVGGRESARKGGRTTYWWALWRYFY